LAFTCYTVVLGTKFQVLYNITITFNFRQQMDRLYSHIQSHFSTLELRLWSDSAEPHYEAYYSIQIQFYVKIARYRLAEQCMQEQWENIGRIWAH